MPKILNELDCSPTTISLLHSVVVGVAVLVVLHVVSGAGVDVAVVVLLKLVQLVVREVELETVRVRDEEVVLGSTVDELEAVRVDTVVLGNKGVEVVKTVKDVEELVAVVDGKTEEFVDENDVGLTVLDVEFQ